MVDSAVLAHRIAAVRDAVSRIRAMLPADAAGLKADRTAWEVEVLNLFVALQECLTLATHWLAEEGWEVPSGYGQAFLVLAEHGVIDASLASRLATAAGLRNLIAHRYGALDYERVHAIASDGLEDLLEFCRALARAVASRSH